MRRRVLVTGAGGFIGRHAVAALEARGAEVIRWTGDLLAGGPVPRADILLHLAWYTEHGRFWTSPLNHDWLAASLTLFQGFLDGGGQRIVGAGSCAEYDWSAIDSGPVAEDAALGPHTLYGETKVTCSARLAEMTRAFSASHAWGRVFFLYGPGEPQTRLIPLMLDAVHSGQPLDCGPGRFVRDFSDARDVGAAFAALALSDVEGAVNIASGQRHSFARIGALIEGLAGTSGLIRFDRRAPGAAEPEILLADTTRLTREVGFAPSIPLATGLADYWAAT